MIEYEEILLCDSISLGYCLMGVKFSGKIVFGLILALNTQLQFRKNIGTYVLMLQQSETIVKVLQLTDMTLHVLGSIIHVHI